MNHLDTDLIFAPDQIEELNKLKRSILDSDLALIDCTMINPDLAPERYLQDRFLEATTKSGVHRYSVSRGTKRLRNAFKAKYENAFNVSLDAEEEICVTMGSKGGFGNIFQSVLPENSRVLTGAPTYPAHLSALRMAGANVEFFEVTSDENFMLEGISEALSRHRYKGLLLNFPHNPTGVIVSKEFYDELGRLLAGTDTLVFNDFVYGEMDFEGRPLPSALSSSALRERVVEVYSMSKAYSVPGWRVAAAAGAPRAISRLSRLQSHLDYGIFLPIQDAAASALTTDYDLVEPVRAEYARRSQVVSGILERAGWEVAPAVAGAFLWAKPKGVNGNAFQFARDLLERTGFAVLPGTLFGPLAREFVRIALVQPDERLRAIENCLNR